MFVCAPSPRPVLTQHLTRTHLHAGVPLLGELAIGEVLWEAELHPEALHVLRQRRAAQQVDLTVREPRLDPLLQQLQDILDGDHRKKRPLLPPSEKITSFERRIKGESYKSAGEANHGDRSLSRL